MEVIDNTTNLLKTPTFKCGDVIQASYDIMVCYILIVQCGNKKYCAVSLTDRCLNWELPKKSNDQTYTFSNTDWTYIKVSGELTITN
jgi:hypothetical protein